MIGQPNHDAASIWCGHCNAAIRPSGIRSCLRPSCQSKALLPDAKKVWK